MDNLVKELEELILAGSGEDSFREIFKLLYIKLYVEKYSSFQKLPSQVDAIYALFEQAKSMWPGVFQDYEIIALPPELLKSCIAILGTVQLLETDLAVLDAAFEQLLPEMAKGNRGQYFTPRYVIRAIVEMIRPSTTDLILDPAVGSGGFLFETIRAKEGKNFSSSQLYGIDFDERAYMTCKALLLIAGYGDAHLYRFNSLEHLTTVVAQFQFPLAVDGWFDVVLTNPPFGGEIRDVTLLDEYELARELKGKVKHVVERHILFLERIIRLLKPGGRGAIVVPQGLLNNTNLAYVRNWLFQRARILGVIGLDVNTFKPFTNVKTSILLLQKWRSSPLSDYPIFMAVSQENGKDASGNLIMKNGDVQSDLGTIAHSFRDFVEKEHLGF